MPLAIKKPSRHDFLPLIEKMQRRLHGCKVECCRDDGSSSLCCVIYWQGRLAMSPGFLMH